MAAKQLDSVQVLRGIAAVAVVFYHSFYNFTIKLPLDINLPAPLPISTSNLVGIGAAGVDVFFVLSGFLMVYISRPYIQRRRSIADFLAHRIIRIWPLYALITVFLCLVTRIRAGPNAFDFQPQRLASIFFVPSFNAAGDVSPILGPGWTLYYEAMFYVTFAIVLLFARQHILRGLAVALAVLYIIGQALPSTSPVHSLLTDCVMFEFLIGAVVGTIATESSLPFSRPMYWIGAGLILLALFGGPTRGPASRFFEQGTAAALIFVGVLHTQDRVRWPRWLLLLGDASYSIYLTHILVIYYVALPGVRRISHIWAPTGSIEAAAIATILLSIGVGVICFRFVEAPLLSLARTLISAKSGRTQASHSGAG
jgi:exopolysaccharide production protein ExoZ